MQLRLIYTFLLSLVAINTIYAQNDTKKLNNDSIVSPNKTKHLFVNVDLSSPVASLFSDKQGAQAAISYQFNANWNAVLELGFEKNKFTESHWNVDVDGVFGKIGVNKYFIKDIAYPLNGFYFGGRLAYASFNQKINQYPIRDITTNQIVAYGNGGKAKVDAYWIEIVIGGKVQMYKNLFADFSLRPSIFLHGKKQDNIETLVIPGYGRNNGPFNISMFWGLSYKLF